jgi:hypothetical protein
MDDRPLHDTQARQPEEGGQPAVRAVEERRHPLDLGERRATEDAQRAGEIAHARRQHEPLTTLENAEAIFGEGSRRPVRTPHARSA